MWPNLAVNKDLRQAMLAGPLHAFGASATGYLNRLVAQRATRNSRSNNPE